MTKPHGWIYTTLRDVTPPPSDVAVVLVTTARFRA